ncbi:hypothetical protein G7054_g4346 [Neopestalotiopsis clavispora]|nr:hypothetical protein G7054_g4346 [Neopestalotiopsis clavispora]
MPASSETICRRPTAQTVAGDHADESSHHDGPQPTLEWSESTTRESIPAIDRWRRLMMRDKSSSKADKEHQDLSIIRNDRNIRAGEQRVMQRWQPDPPPSSTEHSLEKSYGGSWNQFETNERLFGLRTDYDENMYTTQIDKSHPRYKERIAHAEEKHAEQKMAIADTMAKNPPELEKGISYLGGPSLPTLHETYERSVSPYTSHKYPPVNLTENPPCNTLNVGNLSITTSEKDLKAIFSKQPGYKRLCCRTKQNELVCFVEFKDTSYATKALYDLHGYLLQGCLQGGIRLGFSKTPLGVRSGPGQGLAPPMNGLNSMFVNAGSGFTTTIGPPPGLTGPAASVDECRLEEDDSDLSRNRNKPSVYEVIGSGINQETLETVSSLPNPAIHTTKKGTGTVLPANTSRISEMIKKSVTQICEAIYHELQPEVDLKRSRAMMRNLGELIKVFAVQLGLDRSHDMSQKIMRFVSKHHNEICAQLKAMFMEGEINDTDPGQSKSEDMSLVEKMKMWTHGLTEENFAFRDNLPMRSEGHGDFEDDELVSASDLPLYITAIFKSAAYSWLVSTLKNRASLSYGDAHVTIASDEIQQIVFTQLQPSFTSFATRFELPGWRETLITGSRYGDSRGSNTRLQDIVVLNASSATDAQVATVGQYMHQVWPDSGALLLQGFQDLIEGKGNTKFILVEVHDATPIIIQDSGSDISVLCRGPAYFVAQCAAQLSWIGCAIQPTRERPAVKTPCLTQTGPFDFLIFLRDETAKRPQIISYLELAGQGRLATIPCVWGFPTRWRPEGFRGVDFPLGLSDISQFLSPHLSFGCPQGELILSGGVAPLCCVEKIGSSWLWHPAPSCTCSTKCISSSDPDLKGPKLDDIARDQHILGRCDKVSQILKIPHCEDYRGQEQDPAEELPAPVVCTTMMKPLGHCSTALQSAQSDSVDTDLLSISSFSCDEEDGPPQSDKFITPIVNSVAIQLVAKSACPQPPTLGIAPCDEESTSNTQCAAGNSAQGLQVKPTSSGLNKGKRKAGDRDEDDDGEDLSRNGGSGKRISTAKASVPQQTFACPFWKLDPNKHRACFNAKLLTSSRVKQHLSRSHTPRFYCQLCFAVFREESAQEQHVIQRSCTRVPGMILDGITPDQQLQLSRKPKLTLTEEERWYRIWDIVLPNHPRPESPYIDSQLSDCCARFREHWQNMGPDILLAEIQSSGVTSTFALDDAARARTLRMILARGLDMIWESWTLSSTTQQPGRVQLPDTPAYTQEHGSARPGSSTPSSSSAVNVTPEAQRNLRVTPWLSTQRQENYMRPTSSTAATYQGAESMFSDASVSEAIQSLEARAESYDIFDMFDDSTIFTRGQNLEADAGDNGNWVDIGL